MKPWYLILVTLLPAALVMAGLWGALLAGARSGCQDARSDILVRYGDVAKSLQQEVNMRTLHAITLGTFVRRHPYYPGFSEDIFPELAADLLQGDSGTYNLQLAPAGVVSSINPLAGNEAAIGHNLFLVRLTASATRHLTLQPSRYEPLFADKCARQERVVQSVFRAIFHERIRPITIRTSHINPGCCICNRQSKNRANILVFVTPEMYEYIVPTMELEGIKWRAVRSCRASSYSSGVSRIIIYCNGRASAGVVVQTTRTGRAVRCPMHLDTYYAADKHYIL